MTQSETSVDHGIDVIRLRVSLKGGPIRTFTFSKDVIGVGRDPEADVFLDNPGVSRQHMKIEKTVDGYFAEDLGSANGTHMNDVAITRRMLVHDDVIHIGKFSLWISLEQDRRSNAPEEATPQTPPPGTTVLSTADLEKLVAKMRPYVEELQATAGQADPEVNRATAQPTIWTRSVVIAVVVGIVAGAGLTWILTR